MFRSVLRTKRRTEESVLRFVSCPASPNTANTNDFLYFSANGAIERIAFVWGPDSRKTFGLVMEALHSESATELEQTWPFTIREFSKSQKSCTENCSRNKVSGANTHDPPGKVSISSVEKDRLRVGKLEKASSSKLLKEFRLLYLDNPSSHAHLHAGHTLVDSF